MQELFSCVAGSHLYGLDTPESDIDIRGIFAYSIDETITLRRLPDVQQTTTPDKQLYELSKFVKLAAQCNPNILELLYVPDEHIMETSAAYQYLVANKHYFLSRRAITAFLGYAKSEFMKAVNKNREYGKNVAKSYDMKNMSHSLRLLYSAAYLLLYREPLVDLRNVPEVHSLVMGAKLGEYSLVELERQYESMLKHIGFLEESDYHLVEHVNMDRIDNIYRETVHLAWGTVLWEP